MIHTINISTILVALTGTLLLFTACGNDHDHHYSPVGIILSQGDDMLVTQEEGVVTYATGDAIPVPAGESTQTISVAFISDDGHHFTPEAGEYSLRHTIGNEEVLGVTHPVDGDEWSFRMNGLQAGSSTIQLELWHAGHSDFRSQNFQVSVTEQ